MAFFILLHRVSQCLKLSSRSQNQYAFHRIHSIHPVSQLQNCLKLCSSSKSSPNVSIITNIRHVENVFLETKKKLQRYYRPVAVFSVFHQVSKCRKYKKVVVPNTSKPSFQWPALLGLWNKFPRVNSSVVTIFQFFRFFSLLELLEGVLFCQKSQKHSNFSEMPWKLLIISDKKWWKTFFRESFKLQ